MEQLHVLFASSGDVWRLAVPKFVEAVRDMLGDMLDRHRFTDKWVGVGVDGSFHSWRAWALPDCL